MHHKKSPINTQERDVIPINGPDTLLINCPIIYWNWKKFYKPPMAKILVSSFTIFLHINNMGEMVKM
jgi:hypothetical protein